MRNSSSATARPSSGPRAGSARRCANAWPGPTSCHSSSPTRQEKGHRLFFLGVFGGSARSRRREVRGALPGAQPSAARTRRRTRSCSRSTTRRSRAACARRSADILLVAMGCPKQEKWIYRHYQNLGVPATIGIGASLDFIAGKFRRAPRLDAGLRARMGLPPHPGADPALQPLLFRPHFLRRRAAQTAPAPEKPRRRRCCLPASLEPCALGGCGPLPLGGPDRCGCRRGEQRGGGGAGPGQAERRDRLLGGHASSTAPASGLFIRELPPLQTGGRRVRRLRPEPSGREDAYGHAPGPPHPHREKRGGNPLRCSPSARPPPRNPSR